MAIFSVAENSVIVKKKVSAVHILNCQPSFLLSPLGYRINSVGPLMD